MSTRYLLAEAIISVKNTRNKGYESSNVIVPYSKVILAVLNKMQENGYISDVKIVENGLKKDISLSAKFGRNGVPLIRSAKAISKPSARIYYTVEQMRHIQARNPFSLIILSTSSGVMTISEAISANKGGEAICAIF